MRLNLGGGLTLGLLLPLPERLRDAGLPLALCPFYY